MFTVRNIGGLALFLAGTTWLWLTPAFATKGVSTSGAMWAITRLLCLVTIAGFSVATWGLFARRDWWETAALASVAVGTLSLLTYLMAARGEEPAGTVAWNIVVHVVMVLGILALLLVPPLQRWVDAHVMGT